MKPLIIALTLMLSSGMLHARIPEVTAMLTSAEVIEVTKEKIRFKVSGDIHVLFLSEKRKNENKEDVTEERPATLIMHEGELIIDLTNEVRSSEELVRFFAEASKKKGKIIIGVHGSHEIGLQHGIVKKLDVKGVLELKYPWLTKREQGGAPNPLPAE